MTGGTIVNHFMTVMIGEFNRKRPEGNLRSYRGHTFKVIEVFTQYRRTCPDGKLHVYLLAAFSASGLVALAVWLLLAIEWLAVNRTP